jgi:hypothetical protein
MSAPESRRRRQAPTPARSSRPQTPALAGHLARTPTLHYRASRDEWSLSVPCQKCGGAELPLITRIAIDRLAESLATIAREVEALGCPACHAFDRRAASGDQPGVWYDPQLGDWVVRVPDAKGPGAILPLELRWFDSSMTLVYQSAADLVYAGETLSDDDEPGEARPKL